MYKKLIWIFTIACFATAPVLAAEYDATYRPQPSDSDLTAIAALSTTSFGRSFLALANANAAKLVTGNEYALAKISAAVAIGNADAIVISGTIPPGTLSAGSTLRIRGFGYVTALGNPTFVVRLGSAGTVSDTAVCTSGSLTGVLNQGTYIDALVTVRTTGASGTAIGNGFAGAATGLNSCASNATITVDTTVEQKLSLSASISGVSAAMNLHNAVVEVVSP